MDRVLLLDAAGEGGRWFTSFRYEVGDGLKDIGRSSMFTKMIGILISILLLYIALLFILIQHV